MKMQNPRVVGILPYILFGWIIFDFTTSIDG